MKPKMIGLYKSIFQVNREFYPIDYFRYSTVTDSTTISSRYHGRNRPRRRKHRLPSGLDRVIISYFIHSKFLI